MDLANNTTTKGKILQTLSTAWPLTARKIYEAINKSDKTTTYKSIHKALTELNRDKIITKTENEYKLNEEWLKTSANNALHVLTAYTKKPNHSTHVNVTKYNNSDEFYRTLILMLKNSKEIRLAAKTPALFLKAEANTHLRETYVKDLWAKIERGDQVYYLFSKELTAKLIKETKDKQALTKLEQLEKYENLHIRYAPVYAVVAQAVSDDITMLSFANPTTTDSVGFLKIEGQNFTGSKEIYDTIFASARSIREFIQEMKKQL